MKSEIELSESIGDLPDSKERNLIKDICIVIAWSYFLVIMLAVAICNADEIDLFFQNVYKWLTL